MHFFLAISTCSQDELQKWLVEKATELGEDKKWYRKCGPFEIATQTHIAINIEEQEETNL